jgi:hypothetical protein
MLLGWLTWAHVIIATMATFLIGGLIAMLLLVTRRKGRKDDFAYGPSMLLGAIVAAAGAARPRMTSRSPRPAGPAIDATSRGAVALRHPIQSGRETWLVNAAATTPSWAGANARTDEVLMKLVDRHGGPSRSQRLVRRRHIDLGRTRSAIC